MRYRAAIIASLADALDEVIDGGVDFLRGLWPKAKFIFHARRNLTRVAASDFWRDADACDAACARRFERVVARYRAYAWRNPQHAMFTTIEGLTSPLRSWRETSRSCALRLVQSAGGTSRDGSVDATDCLEADLGRLFRWLGEELTTSLRSTGPPSRPRSPGGSTPARTSALTNESPGPARYPKPNKLRSRKPWRT